MVVKEVMDVRIEREALGKALQVLTDVGYVVIEAAPRSGLTLFLSQIGGRLAADAPSSVHYVNAAVPGLNLFEYLAGLLNIESSVFSHAAFLDALKKNIPLVILIDNAHCLSGEGQNKLRMILRLFGSERLFSSSLARVYVAVGTYGHWQDSQVQLRFFSKSEVAALLQRRVDDRVTLAVYAWGRGAPELTRDIAGAVCYESSVGAVYGAVHHSASHGKLSQVARARLSLADLRKIGLADERRPLPAVNLALKLLMNQRTGLVINSVNMEVRYQGKLIALYPKETRILLHLASSPGRIYTASQIYSAVNGGQELYMGDKSVKAQMSRLRAKLPCGEEWIVTRRGLGYSFNPRTDVTVL